MGGNAMRRGHRTIRLTFPQEDTLAHFADHGWGACAGSCATRKIEVTAAWAFVLGEVSCSCFRKSSLSSISFTHSKEEVTSAKQVQVQAPAPGLKGVSASAPHGDVWRSRSTYQVPGRLASRLASATNPARRCPPLPNPC